MPHTEVLSIPLDILTHQEFLDVCESYIAKPSCKIICTPNPEMCVEAQYNSKFRIALLNADCNIADGAGLVWAAKFLHQAHLHRLPGMDMMLELCDTAQHKGWPVFLLGGRSKSSKEAAAILNTKFPKIKINIAPLEPSVSSDGIISNYEEGLIFEHLQRLEPKILFVALGAPKQELWMYNNRDKLSQMGIRLAMGVGGSFDYLSGRSTRAPRLFRAIGLEWLWRLILEPWRWHRIIKATITFPRYVKAWKKRLTLPLRPGVTVVIINQQKQVLTMHGIKNNLDDWVLPGGGVEQGETNEQAALREAREETGLKNLKIIKPGPTYQYLWPLTWSRENYKGQVKQIYFIKYDGNDNKVILEPTNFDQYQWVDVKNLADHLHPTYRQVGKMVMETDL